MLKIRDARVEDSGMYECQVSTQPVRSYFVHLRVGGKLLRNNPFIYPQLSQHDFFHLRVKFFLCLLKTLPPEVIFRLTLEIKEREGFCCCGWGKVLCLQHPLAPAKDLIFPNGKSLTEMTLKNED